MAITREFCRMLGGDILCTSELGKGTTFTMRLPVDSRVPGARPEHEPEPVGADVSLPVDAPLVLVIDDDANVRNLLKRNLAAAGIRAVLAAGGPDGLQLVKELRPDAITLDVMMPGTDGWTVLSELKADPETADIPVIMVTIVEDRQLGFSLGASEYLPKPVDRARLIAVLRRYLGEKADRPVLIVDDDDEARQMIGRILDREGVTFAEAENGRVGLEKLARERPALILLDLMMPEMDGFEFVERVRANPDWQDIPIIVITAKMLTEEERARLNGRVADLYRKADNNIEDVITSLCKRLRLTARVGAAVAPGHG
jgi:CheY-like chemotaxis protein